jgi:RNA polymerase sigma-70 factor (ECF subfamily)
MAPQRPGPAWASMSDEELAQHCAEEMGECLTELVARYDGRIRSCARRMSLTRDQAEDLAGEIYLRLVASLPSFGARSAFGTWLYRLAHNTCIDAYRREGRRARLIAAAPAGPDRGSGTAGLLDRLAAGWGEPPASLEDRIRECYVGQALSRLPGDYRQIVLLRLAEGRSSADVARLLGTSVDSVKARLQRARRLLKQDLLTPRACPFCRRAGVFRITGTGQVS